MPFLKRIKNYVLSIIFQKDKVESTIVNHNQPVYIPRYVTIYKDRENLIELQKKIDNLTDIALDSIFLQNNMKTREQLIEELNSLRKYEGAVCLNKKQLAEQYKAHTFELNSIIGDFDILNVTADRTHSDNPLKLYQIKINREQNEIRIFFDPRHYVSVSEEIFSIEHPQIYTTLLATYNKMLQIDLERNWGQNIVPDPTIHLVYKDRRTYSYESFFLDTESCVLIHGFFGDLRENLINKMEEVQLENLQKTYDEFDSLVRVLNTKIYTEQRRQLIQKETTNTSTQTMDFSLNEFFYEHINTFLDKRDKMSFSIATKEGKNLNFDGKPTVTINSQRSHSLNNYEIGFIEGPLPDNINELLLSFIQNPSLMFAAALSTIVVHNFQTIELAAQVLLSFNYIPGYNDAFVAAAHLTVTDLQNTYKLSEELAQRASQVLSYAYDHKFVNTDYGLNTFNNEISPLQKINWNNLFLTSVIVVGVFGVGFLSYQAFKMGISADSLIKVI